MQAPNTDVSRMCAVTLSREYGSGGGEVASRLAEKLGWRLVDHEIVVRTARELGISEREAEEWDESGQGVVEHLLSSMRMLYPATFAMPLDAPLVTDEQSYYEALNRVVQSAVKTGHMVIVGRGSQMILKGRRDVLHVRIVATLEKRIRYVMEREGVPSNEAQSRIQLKDTERARYLQTHYRQHADDAHLYDLVINTSILDLDFAVNTIQLALQQKATRLDLAEEALGPGAGVQRYPGRPGDIHSPVASKQKRV